jgi:uncharacterized SAM-binding protein YcdF (DUF218 family)
METTMNQESTDTLAKILWNYQKLHQSLEKSDCIIVLGSHDQRVAERGTHIFQDGYAPFVVFSGGFGRLTDNRWMKPEAEIFADIALSMGVQKERMLIENTSTNTAENLQFTKKLLDQKGLLVTKVTLVTMPYMERRAFATWRLLYPEIEVIMTSPISEYDDDATHIDISKEEMIHILVGETQRVKDYPQKGYILPQEVPTIVWEAYEELVKRGFTAQLIKA